LTESHRITLDINLNQIAQNIQLMATRVSPAIVMPILKANAYGLGAIPIAQFLSQKKIQLTGVSNINEASDLTPYFKEIHILGDVFDNDIKLIQENGWICPLTSFSRLKTWSNIIKSNGKKLKVQLYLDTGMGQLGLKPAEVYEGWEALKNLENIELAGLYSHFTGGDFLGDPNSRLQLKMFQDVATFLLNNGVKFSNTHIGNSSAMNFMPDSYQGFSHVRTGINMYGIQKNIVSRENYLKPVLELKSKIISIKKMTKGDTVGYNRIFRATGDTIVATIPAGYADGVPFGAKDGGKVLVHGQVCPILGRVSMDYISVDISHLTNAKIENPVILIGKQGNQEITVEDWAAWKNSIPYDVICSLNSPRIQKNYISE
jgi:alanine racemase